VSAHATWYAGVSRWCAEHVRTADQPTCLRIARAERNNIDAALAWCSTQDPALGTDIATRMGWTWVVMGEGTAGAARLRKADSLEARPRHRLQTHLLAGWLEASAGDVQLAEDDISAARDIATALADDLAGADVERHEAFVALQQGRPDLAARSARRSLEAYRPADRQWEAAASLILAGYAALMVGDTATAGAEAATAAQILAPIDDAWGLLHAQALLAGVARAEGRLGDASRALREAAENARVLDFPGQVALHLTNLGEVERRLGQDRGAERTLRRAIDQAIAAGDGRLAATARLHLAQLLRAEGQRAAALDLLERNVEWYTQSGGGDGALLSRCILAAERRDGAALASVLDEAERTQDLPVRVHALDAQARHAAMDARSASARTLLERADEAAALAPAAVAEWDRHDKHQAMSLLSPSSTSC
jgi:tetratricopeptide (TPR) repeat protein